MAPENFDNSLFVSPFAQASPVQDPTQDAPLDAVTEIDDEDETGAAPAGVAFGLVFQAADPEQRVPKRVARQPRSAVETETDDRDTASASDADAEDAAGDDTSADATSAPRRGRERSRTRRQNDEDAAPADERSGASNDDADDEDDDQTPRRRRRGGRGRRTNKAGEGPKGDSADSGEQESADSSAGPEADASGDDADDAASRKRTRRRRRSGSSGADNDDPNTVTKVREPRRAKDEVTSIKGSTRLEAKKQRRREGREAGRRRTVITEAEFLARRESVERVMVVREQEGRTQIGVLEDGVLAEHYVSRQEQASSMAGNVYLGRVQNVLPSMEAAFVDIGRGRNAVLYAGEVNWDAAGLDNQPKRIEHALKAGESVLVQVTKDPIGHKGARLTSQISLPGRFVVFVPGNSMTGISRKLPDTERSRLKRILKEVVPADAGVIVRTAAEGASEEELRADVERLMKLWEKIQKKSQTANAPSLLHGEPDLTVRVIRDVFNEDFAKMVVSGDRAWNEVHGYISEVAPDLVDRLQKWDGERDVFAKHRIDEQLAKAMDRKVWLPSGGSLVIDRTEAMTVVDVNTGKFVGAGGNLEETVTKNNIEAAEEIVRQLRLRDIGGIIVVDFIDMVLESNRELVVRRLLECLGRDRTKHQVAEVTSLGLVQMTRKRVGAGLVEMFSETCESCQGRGIVIHDHPVENRDINGNESFRKGRGRGGRGGRDNGSNASSSSTNESNEGAKGESRDGGFAQIAAAAHAAAISAGDKSATSEPVSTASSDEAIIAAPVADATPVESAGQVRSSGRGATGGADKPRRTGRVQRRSERAVADDVAAPDAASNEAPASRAEAPKAQRDSGSVQGAAPKRRSRRAAVSTGAPTSAGQAQVMTVTAAATEPSRAGETSSESTEASTRPEPVEQPPSNGGVATAAKAKRPRRRAGSSAGAPVSLQPVDLASAPVTSAPLTKVAGEASDATAAPDAAAVRGVESEEPKAPARKKRARVSSPAGAPGAMGSTES